MTDTLTIYGRKTSSNVQAVMWGLTELGLTAQRIDVGGRHGGLDTDAFGALNPNRLIPVLIDGDGPPLWESNTILRYLGNRYGAGPIWPEPAQDRAQVDMWMEWGKTTLTNAFTVPIFWSRVRTMAKDRDQAALDAAVRNFDHLLERLDAQLAHQDYVTGAEFTLADVVLGHIFFRYYDIDIPRRSHPPVDAWYQRLAARAAFQDHVMVDYSELRVDGA